MKKKIIIFSAIIAVFVLVSLTILFFTGNKNSTTQDASQQSNQVSLPSTQSDQENIRNTVKDELNKEKTNSNTYAETNLKTKNNQATSLKDFMAAENIFINDEVYNNIDQSNFRLFSCCDKKDVCGKGIIFSISQMGGGKQVVARYENADGGLRKWESSLSQDMKKFFFDGYQIDPKTKSQFQSTKFLSENGANTVEMRYTNFKDKEGNDLSIDYAFFDSQIFISNDKDCIRKALNKYEDVLEP